MIQFLSLLKINQSLNSDIIYDKRTVTNKRDGQGGRGTLGYLLH